MKLHEFKALLCDLDELTFRLKSGKCVPAHFHITEVGSIRKHFIDCGGTVREHEWVSFQLWSAHDVEHRLKAAKLMGIIALSERRLGLGNHEIVVEYQASTEETIGLYQLYFEEGQFVLTPTHTDCLALDQCGIPAVTPAVNACTGGVGASNSCCG